MDPNLESLDFYNFLAYEFGMKMEFDNKGAFLKHLKTFLHEADTSNQKVLLVIDEAQSLKSGLLEQIRLLSNIEREERKLLNMFFVGQSEFKKMLLEEENKAFRARITVNYHLEPLTERETLQYVAHRLKVAGVNAEIFSGKAIHEIFSFSCGNPRLINIISHHALLTGYAAELSKIDEGVIRDCQKELQIVSDACGDKTHKLQASLQAEKLGLPGIILKQYLNKTAGPVAALIFLILIILAGYLTYKSLSGKKLRTAIIGNTIEMNDESLTNKQILDAEINKNDREEKIRVFEKIAVPELKFTGFN